MIEDARREVPGLTITVDDMVEAGDEVWARSTAHGFHPATHEPIEFTVFDVCRFQDGRIVEHWGVPDRFALLHQIGALPPRP
jgi:predicted ester cyclase